MDMDLKLFRLSFDSLMLLFVLISSIVLAAEGPPNHPHAPAVGATLRALDWACFVAFAAECILKIVADGFILTPRAYLTNRWNWLDLAVVVFSTIDVVLTAIGKEVGFAAIFRLLRILRPLKLLRLIDGMHVVLKAIKSAAPAVAGIALCILVTFTAFGILGAPLIRLKPGGATLSIASY